MTYAEAPARSRRRGFRVLVAGVAALLPLAVFAIFATSAAIRAYRAADEARLEDTVRALAAAVDAQLGSYIATLEALATPPLGDVPEHAAALEARARVIGERLGGTMFLVGPSPDHRTPAGPQPPPGTVMPPAPPEHVRAALSAPIGSAFGTGEASVSDLFDGPGAGRPLYAVVVPVEPAPDRGSALALAIEPASLQRLLARQSLPDGTFAAITDGRLRIVAQSVDPDGLWVGRPAPAWAAPAIRGRQRVLVTAPDLTGQDTVFAIERLTRAPGWTVVVGEPVAQQRASAWHALRWMLAGAATLALGVAVVVWAANREAVRAARREAEAMRAGRAEVERLHSALPAVIFLSRTKAEGASLRVQRVYRGGDMATVLGWQVEDLAVLPNLASIADYGSVSMTDHFRMTIERGEHEWEWRVHRKDGSWSWIRTRARCLSRGPDGSAEVVGYNLNIDRERTAEARAMASARLASLGEMAAGLAHEIKQPLAAMSLAAEAAQISVRAGDVSRLDDRLESIMHQAQRTADLIERLRRFARGAEEGVPPEPTALASVLESALDLMRSALRDAEIRIDVALDPAVPLVWAQPVLLEQVLTNLLLNARDALASLPRSAPRQIRIEALPDGGSAVRLIVADTGGGIPPAVMARLFEPFVTTKGPDKGTGLGLSICHGLVKAMGGHIEAENGAEGAVFTLTLRAAPGGDAAAAQEDGAAGLMKDVVPASADGS